MIFDFLLGALKQFHFVHVLQGINKESGKFLGNIARSSNHNIIGSNDMAGAANVP